MELSARDKLSNNARLDSQQVEYGSVERSLSFPDLERSITVLVDNGAG